MYHLYIESADGRRKETFIEKTYSSGGGDEQMLQTTKFPNFTDYFGKFTDIHIVISQLSASQHLH